MNRAAVIALAGIGVVAAALMTRKVVSTMPAGNTSGPRGIRNNNPGNLMDAGIQWQGMTGADTGGYLIFASPLEGIRAMALNLHNYYLRDGLHTINGIITRWAPPASNDTEAYIADVAHQLGVSPSQVINVDAALPRLIPAIIRHENGVQPYSAALIAQGIAAAGIRA